jgi:ketopantoate reductase
MNNPTKILIVGTGAIGGYFGGRLSQNPGNEVFFLARGKNLSNLKKKPINY